MYEQGVTARKVAVFDNSILDPVRELLGKFDWAPESDPKKYLREKDGTHLLYLPNCPERMQGFYTLTGKLDKPIIDVMVALRKPINHFMRILGIDDPVLVQADIAHMPPGGDTIMHNDTRVSQRYSRRYNIAIETNPSCFLYHYSYDLEADGKRDHIEPGEIWELNNKIPHTAVNQGDTWRTHLIIDVMPKVYWNRMLEMFPNPYNKVPNPIGKNYTYDVMPDGQLFDYPKLFKDLPHCFPARTHV